MVMIHLGAFAPFFLLTIFVSEGEALSSPLAGFWVVACGGTWGRCCIVDLFSIAGSGCNEIVQYHNLDVKKVHGHALYISTFEGDMSPRNRAKSDK
jgi:hypothetical protein